MGKINNVLFIGNSITRVFPTPDIGWYGDWGMAASSEEKDYVHVLVKKILIYNPDAVFKVKITADFERNFWEYDIQDLKEIRDFRPDMIIMRIGENVNDEAAGTRDFGNYYSQLIDYMNPSRSAVVICTNCFWDNSNVSPQIENVSKENGYLFVDISELHKDEKNMAKDKLWHKGVGAHPSDTGMENIANLI